VLNITRNPSENILPTGNVKGQQSFKDIDYNRSTGLQRTIWRTFGKWSKVLGKLGGGSDTVVPLLVGIMLVVEMPNRVQ